VNFVPLRHFVYPEPVRRHWPIKFDFVGVNHENVKNSNIVCFHVTFGILH